jgi:hypothetical protein
MDGWMEMDGLMDGWMDDGKTAGRWVYGWTMRRWID